MPSPGGDHIATADLSDGVGLCLIAVIRRGADTHSDDGILYISSGEQCDEIREDFG